ncbi:hypothetical protein [Streptomyces sp. NPDC003077]|uniref:hypothetical protein n=1 Tax=Streptomyces sp. NPDC003077 TaxID=3154443 RepID=UPI0033A3A5C8
MYLTYLSVQESREAPMTAHEPTAAAARRAQRDAHRRAADHGPRPADGPTPTMNQLLAACAAATAVSTPPKAPERPAMDRDAEEGADATPPSGAERNAA